MDQNITPQNVRISMPSKGRLMDDTRAFFADCGISVHQENPRQYEALIPNMPGVSVLFQRPADIVVSVRDGSVDFGITGLDVAAEHQGKEGSVLILHEALGFGQCALTLAVPEEWASVTDLASLKEYVNNLGRPIKV